MPFRIQQLLIFAFLFLCLGEFWAATTVQEAGRSAPQVVLRPIAMLWVLLPVVPFGAFVLRYGRPPQPPARRIAADERFWWLLVAVCLAGWALLRFVIVGRL